MTTTAAELQARTGLELCFVLVFDGVDLAYVSQDPDGIATAWAATDWTTFKSGLSGDKGIIGTMSQSIRLFEGSVRPDSLTFTVLDVDDTLISTAFRDANDDANRTYLSANADNNDTTISVKAADGFAASGKIYIGQEAIDYSSRDTGADTFTVSGSGRGYWSLFGPNGGARFGQQHRMTDTATPDIQQSPAVSDAPSTWYNRRVGLYVHHRLEDGTWSTKADALLVWAGRIQSYRDIGDGRISFGCVSLLQDLRSSVFTDQMVGQLGAGVSFVDDVFVRIVGWNGTGGGFTSYYASQTITATGGNVTHEEFATLVNDALATLNASLTYHIWSLELDTGGPYPAYRFVVEGADQPNGFPTPASALYFAVSIGGVTNQAISLYDLLGFDYAAQVQPNTALVLHEDPSGTNNQWFVGAASAALIYTVPYNVQFNGDSITFDLVSGTWNSQPASTLSAATWDTDGFVKIGDLIIAITEPTLVSDNTYTANVRGFYLSQFHAIVPFVTEPMSIQHGQYRADAVSEPPTVAQVWIESSLSAADVLLRLMLSTGVSGYNDSTYDVYPYGMGIGLPYGMVDVPSFAELDKIPYELVLLEPMPFDKFIEAIGAATNSYIVWRDGKITCSTPVGFVSPYQIGVTQLTESNKATAGPRGEPDRSTVDYVPNALINRMTLEYAFGADKNPQKTITVVADASISDFQQQRSIRIKAPGLIDGAQWIDTVAAPALAYFSRPMAVISRSIDHSLLHLTPGEAVSITDNGIIDPVTGTRGVTNFPAWVLSVDFDWGTAIGKITCAFLPGKDWNQAATWSPSAKVASYVGGTKTITLSANQFSDSSESVDASYFVAGDKIRVVEESPATPAAPDEHYRNVVSVSGNDIVHDGSAITFASTTTNYIVEPDDADTVATTQLIHAFIGDDANDLVPTNHAPYYYGNDLTAATLPKTAPDYTLEHVFMDTQADDAGEPFSVRKMTRLVESLNNFFGVKSCPVLINDILGAAATMTGTTSTLLYGPIQLPIMAPVLAGGGTRTFKVTVKAHVSSGTGHIVIKSSPNRVTGASSTALVYHPSTSSVDVSFTNTTTQYQTEATLTVRPNVNSTWITIEGYASGGGITVTLSGVTIREAHLS